MNPYKTSLFRSPLRTFLALALLLGSLSIGRVSNAQTASVYLNAALQAANGGTAVTGSAIGAGKISITVIDNALKAEAMESATSTGILTSGTFASDINYLLYYLNVDGKATAYYSLLVDNSIPYVSGSALNSAPVAAGVAGAFAPYVGGDSSKDLLALYLSTEALAGTVSPQGFYNAIPLLIQGVAATLSGTVSTFGSNAGLIAEYAVIPITKSTSASTLIPELAPAIANDVATSSTSLTIAEQALVTEDVANLLLKAYASTALATATTVEQTVLTEDGSSAFPTIAGDFSADLPTEAAYIAALAASQPGANIALVSGSATSAASAYATSIAYRVALTTGSANAATVASAVGGKVSSDAVREQVAENVIAAQPTQDAAVAGAVAAELSDADKEVLALLISEEDFGTLTVDSTTLNQAGHIAAMAQSVAASVSATEATLGTVAGLIAEYAAIPLAKSSSAATLVPEYLPALANAVATSSTAVTVADQALITEDVVNLIEKAYAGAAITTATTVEQTALTANGSGGAAMVAGDFAADLTIQSPQVAALAAIDFPAVAAAVTGSAVNGASAYATTIAYQVALVSSTGSSASIAAAAASASKITSDASRELIAEYVVAAQPTQDGPVAGAVAATLSDTDKEVLSLLLAEEDFGTLKVNSVTLNQPGSIANMAASIAAAVSGTSPTLGSVAGLIAEYAAIPFAKSASAAAYDLEYDPGIANAVATSSTNITLADQALITEDVANLELKASPSAAIATATTVEQTAITAGSDRAATAAAFSADIPLYAPNIATSAATGQTATVAGAIGVAVADVPIVEKYGALPTIALDVATAAASATEPTSTFGNASDNQANDKLYAVAEAFGAASGTYGSAYAFSIVQKLANASTLGGTNIGSGSTAPTVDVIPALVTAFTSHMPSTSYIVTVVELMSYYFPQDAPDIIGSVAATLPVGASVNASTLEADVIGFAEASANTATLEALTATNTKAAADAAATAAIEKAYGYGTTPANTYFYNAYYNGGAGVSPDETVVVNL